ncbi:putative blue pigment (indigoidine) exporter [Kribbella sp. VKM Ac-2571]|nr:putative blue pigment (indigoidine) exporter [Kribbella sp. VKM Ac-2571]
MLSNRRSTILLTTAIAPMLWGTTYVVTTEFLPPHRPLLAALLRALPAGLLLVAVTRVLPRGSWWWRSLLLGTLNIGAFNAFLFVGAYRLPGGVAATVGAIQPLLVALLSAGLLRQRLSLRTVFTALAGVFGVGLLVLRATARLDMGGVLAAAGAAVVMAFGVVLSKRWTSPAPLLATTGWQLVAGGLVLLPVAFLVEGAFPAFTLRNVAGYAYLALFGSALAYALWFRGLRELVPTEVTFLGLLSPVVATTVGWLVLSQHLTALQAVGGLIVLAALAFAQVRPAAQRLDKSLAQCIGDGVGAVPELQAAGDVVEDVLDRPLRVGQLPGDLLRVHAVRDKSQYLSLPVGETGVGQSSRCHNVALHPRHLAEQPSQQVRRQAAVTRSGGLDEVHNPVTGRFGTP